MHKEHISQVPQPYHDAERSVWVSDTEIVTTAPRVPHDALGVMANQLQMQLVHIDAYERLRTSVLSISDIISNFPTFANQKTLCELHMRYLLGVDYWASLKDVNPALFRAFLDEQSVDALDGLTKKPRHKKDVIKLTPSAFYLCACLMSPVIWSVEHELYRLDVNFLEDLTQSLSTTYLN